MIDRRYPVGKGVYIWNQKNILDGKPETIVKALVAAKVDYVVIKIHDGTTIWENLEPLFEAVREAGMIAGAWGYVYLKWNPAAEARAMMDAIKRYNPMFYLLDAEAQAKNQHANAKIFASTLRQIQNDVPFLLNTYYRPDLHPELPWDSLLSVCSGVCPQVYWRGYKPVEKLWRSVVEYAKKTSKPMPMVAGDMYLEHNLKPTPEQLHLFLEATHQDEAIQAVHFWSMDQIKVVPELWEVFASYDWKGTGVPEEPIIEPEMTDEEFAAMVVGVLQGAVEFVTQYATYYHYLFRNGGKIPQIKPVDAILNAAIAQFVVQEPKPLFNAAVTAWLGLRVRSATTTVGNTPLYKLNRGDLVQVWVLREENGYEWAKISKDNEEWVVTNYLKRL